MTYEFDKRNLENVGYTDIVLLHADGGLGYPEMGPYDRIAITAACRRVPSPLIEQLKIGGRAISPVAVDDIQELQLLEKDEKGVHTTAICEVLYVALRGMYGR